jgi:hypothetical protein
MSIEQPQVPQRASRRRRGVVLAAVGAAGLTAAVAVGVRPAAGQQAPTRLTVGIYAPTVEFDNAQERLQYVQGLAKAIETSTGVKTEAEAFSSLGALRKAAVDFAILEAQCYAGNQGWRLLATASIGGATSRTWALFSSVGGDLAGLAGKKLAFVQTGCDDAAFVDHAMLESEVAAGYFGARVGKPELRAAVAEVVSYKGAQAVFAPVGSAKGLTKVFDTGAVPNPAFVALNGKLPAELVGKVQASVTGYGAAGAIGGWSAGKAEAYAGLAGRMAASVKKGVFAAPEPVRFEARDVLVEPPTLVDQAWTSVDQHFEQPPARLP